jgi:hypothetical protein
MKERIPSPPCARTQHLYAYATPLLQVMKPPVVIVATLRLRLGQSADLVVMPQGTLGLDPYVDTSSTIAEQDFSQVALEMHVFLSCDFYCNL